MLSERENVKMEILARLKDEKKRFIVLDPNESWSDIGNDNSKEALLLNHYEALVNARGHARRMKGKYNFIFDLENQGHFEKLEQMLDQESSYRIYMDSSLFSSGPVPNTV